MIKVYILIFLLFFSIPGFAQFPSFERTYYVKPYKLALTITNPASAMLKYGGGVEYRRGNRSYMLSYLKYTGAYYGKEYDAEYRLYFRKYMMHVKNKWIYQDFVYFRNIVGDMGYDGEKFAVLGQKEKKYADLQFYAGFAPGYGRRYHKGPLFFLCRAGIRAIAIPVDDKIKSLYRLFYFTGPGSIVEVNFQFGLQL